MTENLISGEPDSPVAGEFLTLCYQFNGVGQGDSVTLEIDWGLGGESADVNVSDEHNNNCKTITVPENATTVIVVDASGVSADWGRVIGNEENPPEEGDPPVEQDPNGEENPSEEGGPNGEEDPSEEGDPLD